jgi:UDP-glucose 4-epimerase
MTYDISGKNVLVTGGTGQIGSFLIPYLLTKNAKITVIGRSLSNLKYLEQFVVKNQVKFIQCDLTMKNALEDVKKSIFDTHYLIHLASDLNPESENPFLDAFNSINVNLNIIPNLLKHLNQLDGICYSSSVSVYGASKSLPLDEKTDTEPITFYGCGKLGAEKFLQLYCDSKSIPLEILRLAPVYGPRNNSNQVIPFLIKKALKNEEIILSKRGQIFRDFIHVFDVIDAIGLAICENKSNCYNIGSGTKHTIKEIASLIIDNLNSKSTLKLNDTSEGFNSIIDISKASTNLNFIPKISMNKGIKTEIIWHQENSN